MFRVIWTDFGYGNDLLKLTAIFNFMGCLVFTLEVADDVNLIYNYILLIYLFIFTHQVTIVQASVNLLEC